MTPGGSRRSRSSPSPVRRSRCGSSLAATSWVRTRAPTGAGSVSGSAAATRSTLRRPICRTSTSRGRCRSSCRGRLLPWDTAWFVYRVVCIVLFAWSAWWAYRRHPLATALARRARHASARRDVRHRQHHVPLRDGHLGRALHRAAPRRVHVGARDRAQVVPGPAHRRPAAARSTVGHRVARAHRDPRPWRSGRSPSGSSASSSTTRGRSGSTTSCWPGRRSPGSGRTPAGSRSARGASRSVPPGAMAAARSPAGGRGPTGSRSRGGRSCSGRAAHSGSCSVRVSARLASGVGPDPDRRRRPAADGLAGRAPVHPPRQLADDVGSDERATARAGRPARP